MRWTHRPEDQRQPDTTPPRHPADLADLDEWEDYEERAGLLEDGAMSREEAEAMAWTLTLERRGKR